MVPNASMHDLSVSSAEFVLKMADPRTGAHPFKKVLDMPTGEALLMKSQSPPQTRVCNFRGFLLCWCLTRRHSYHVIRRPPRAHLRRTPHMLVPLLCGMLQRCLLHSNGLLGLLGFLRMTSVSVLLGAGRKLRSPPLLQLHSTSALDIQGSRGGREASSPPSLGCCTEMISRQMHAFVPLFTCPEDYQPLGGMHSHK